jgi:hypothetical protein
MKSRASRSGIRCALFLAPFLITAEVLANPATAEENEAFKDDYSQLRERAALLSVTKDAVGWRIDRVNHSLDIKIGSLSSQKAESAAHFACDQPLDHRLHRTWYVRVYLVDGHLAAECPIWGGGE